MTRRACQEFLELFKGYEIQCGLGEGHVGQHRVQAVKQRDEWFDGRCVEVSTTVVYRWPAPLSEKKKTRPA